ncbi:MAG: glycosyltransferase N-terminal domain-containing protein [Humidesulfovibrio sp.]|nr:glycosyltransferase N-terminal domain-containing protein [Humidesulfovibrio sp.]
MSTASKTDAARPLPLGARLMLGIYGLAWRAALPALKRNKRLREGWEARTLSAGPPPKADLWIQAASGGEAYLAWELLSRLPELSGCARPLTVLVTTFTSQGLGVLAQAREALAPRLDLVPAYVPFDLPGRMDQALTAVAPKAVVLLETEIWPGLLAACRKRGVPALVLNARMTEKSLAGYLRLPGFWRAFSPARVLAVSEADTRRFTTLFPDSRVGVMHNIKFDRLSFTPAPPKAEIAALLPEGAPFLVLGSVRKQEEDAVLSIVRGLLQRQPSAVIGLFPRHMERAPAWCGQLEDAGVPFARRSGGEMARPGSVIVWDAFGELGAAFGLARACFLGGSLADLGGQNFLEPLAHGVVPVIGPFWSNFAWVGEEIFSTGIVRRETGWQGVLDTLSALASDAPDRQTVREKAEIYAASRRGGGEAACQAVAECLNCG